jgi:hypothetical protein
MSDGRVCIESRLGGFAGEVAYRLIRDGTYNEKGKDEDIRRTNVADAL